jgi:hypothetical protein
MTEAVISMALFFVIGSSFVYATTVIEDSRKQSLNETTATISQTGTSNSFRSDINSARGLKLVNERNLLVAKTDGSCVSWTLSQPSGSTTSSLLRASVQGAAVTAGSGSELSKGITSGALSLSGDSASLTMNYSSASSFSEVVPLRIAASDGGVCW